MLKNQPQISPLLDLPFELREQIWREYISTSPEYLFANVCKKSSGVPSWVGCLCDKDKALDHLINATPPLAQVNKQIGSEVGKVLGKVSGRTLSFCSAGCANEFVQRMSKNLFRAMDCVEFGTHDLWCMQIDISNGKIWQLKASLEALDSRCELIEQGWRILAERSGKETWVYRISRVHSA